MSDPKWTPGRWRVRDDAGPPMTDVEAGDRVLATAYPRNHTEQPSADAILRGYAEAEANARLIAAAPDLYVALSALVEDVEVQPDTSASTWSILEDGRSALAKARGEP